MTFESDPARQFEEPPKILRPRRRRWLLVLLALIFLGLAGAGGTYAWANFGVLAYSFAHAAPDSAGDPGDKTVIPDILAAQQKASEHLDALSKTVDEQQQQLKSVVDQLAALTSRIDALPRTASPIQAPPPFASQPQTPVAQAEPRPRKPLPSRAPKPAGIISTGGAPLTPDPGTR